MTTYQFQRDLGKMRTLFADIRRTYDTASGGKLHRILACMRSPGVDAVIALRFGQWVASLPAPFRFFLAPLYLLLQDRVKTRWGIEIPRGTRIGAGLYIGHFGGIVISPLAKIGKQCTIAQGVTIGVSGQGERFGAPTIGDNVFLAAGSKIIGKITVGNNVKVGANAVVYKDIPDDAVVVLDPGFKIVSMKGNVFVPPSSKDGS